MPTPLRSQLILPASSLLAGVMTGKLLVTQPTNPPPENTVTAAESAAVETDATSKNVAGAALNAATKSTFTNLPLPQQLETLIRISKQAAENPSVQLLLAQIANDLPAPVLEELLSSLAGRKDGPFLATTLLAERLAAIDPSKAIELGTQHKSPQIVEAGLSVLLAKNAADAIKALAALPKDISASLSNIEQSGLVTPGGSFSDAVRVIQSQPNLLENVANAKQWEVSKILGALAAKTAATDPALALAEIRASAAEIVNSNPKRDPATSDLQIAKQRDALVSQIAGNAVNHLRFESGPDASKLFDALKDTEKKVWSFSIEAVTRYNHSGSETAISFAESQASKENMSSAASGVWWALANQDRPAALAWIESLPPGAFREGTLKSVMMDAWNRSKSWGDPDVAMTAAATLLSRGSQVDYYAAMLSDRHFAYNDGRTRAEFIAELPLTPQEKTDLERRLAPVKPR
jgi:hypothetical protein